MWHNLLSFFAAAGDACNPAAGARSFFGLPPWYKYLDGKQDTFGRCVPDFDWSNWSNANDLWSIALVAVEIMLRIGALVAIGYIIFAGFQYMTSSGEPDKTKNAKSTIINALVGLAIAILATSLVSFIGNQIK